MAKEQNEDRQLHIIEISDETQTKIDQYCDKISKPTPPIQQLVHIIRMIRANNGNVDFNLDKFEENDFFEGRKVQAHTDYHKTPKKNKRNYKEFVRKQRNEQVMLVDENNEEIGTVSRREMRE